jgi:hypothetical protein
MGDAPSPSGLLTWRCYVPRAGAMLNFAFTEFSEVR